MSADDNTPNDPTTFAELYRLLKADIDALREDLTGQAAEAWRATAAHTTKEVHAAAEAIGARIDALAGELREEIADAREDARSSLSHEVKSLRARVAILERRLAPGGAEPSQEQP